MMNLICIIAPLIGGGTERYTEEISIAWSKQGYPVLLIQYVDRFISIKILKEGKVINKKRFFQDGTWAFWSAIEDKFDIQFVHVQHFIYSNINLIHLYKNLAVPLFFTLHDYYTVCPQINMFTQGTYCGEKGEKNCEICLKRGIHNNFHKVKKINIVDYRNRMYQILCLAKKIFVPSHDMKTRLLKYFDGLPIDIWYNPEVQEIPNYLDIYINRKSKDIIHVGLIGNLTAFKGARILINCAQIALRRNKKLKFIIFGEIENCKLSLPPNIQVLGKYKEDEIYKLISQYKIDFCWFPTQCPETYSYVLSIPAKMHIPSLGGNLGALGERIIHNNWGEVYPYDLQETKIVDLLCRFRYEQFKIDHMKPVEQKEFPNIEKFYGISLIKENMDIYDINNDILNFLDSYNKIQDISKISWQEYKYLRLLGMRTIKLLFLLDKKEIFWRAYKKYIKNG